MRSCVLITSGSERVNLVMHLNVTNNYNKFYFTAANFSSARGAEILFQLQDESHPWLNPSPCNRQFDFWRICFRSQYKIRHVIRPLEKNYYYYKLKTEVIGVFTARKNVGVKNARRPVKRKYVLHVF